MRAESQASKERALEKWQVEEDQRLRREAQVTQRRGEARARLQAARQEVVQEEEEAAAAEAAPEPEPTAVPAPELQSEAVARMMRERREAREETQREIAALQARAAARRSGSGGAATGSAPTAVVYNRALFQRPLLPAEGTAAAPAAAPAAPGAHASAAAKDAWAWAQQREAAPPPASTALDAVSE